MTDACVLNFEEWRQRLRPSRRKPKALWGGSLEQKIAILEKMAVLRRQRPKPVAVLEPFPPLMARYMELERKEQNAFAAFAEQYEGYLQGRNWGDYISFLHKRAMNQAAALARTCRYTNQLLAYFAFHQQNTPDVSFTAQYLRTSPAFRRQFHTEGETWLRNVRNAGMRMKDLVSIADYAAPQIHSVYDSRERQAERRRKIVQLYS